MRIRGIVCDQGGLFWDFHADSDEVEQLPDLGTGTDLVRKSQFDLFDMLSDKSDSKVLFIIVDQREGAHKEGVELDRLVLALGTVHHRLVLPIHQVDNDRLVAFEEKFPGLCGHHVIGPSVIVLGLSIGLIDDSVEILVQSVQHVVDELTRVMLAVSREHGLELADRPFHHTRCN